MDFVGSPPINYRKNCFGLVCPERLTGLPLAKATKIATVKDVNIYRGKDKTFFRALRTVFSDDRKYFSESALQGFIEQQWT